MDPLYTQKPIPDKILGTKIRHQHAFYTSASNIHTERKSTLGDTVTWNVHTAFPGPK